jgi:hypothetical protein
MMGYILDLPATAGPFNAETRRESFYIVTDYDDIVLAGRRQGDLANPAGSFSVPTALVPALITALEAVQLSRHHLDWAAGDGLRRADITPDAAGVEWVVTRQDDRLVLSGRVIVFVGEGEWAPAQSVELCYRDLADLLQHLAGVVG